MIYNRTEEDVKNAQEIIKDKVQNFKTLTDDDLQILEKGTITISTLNRIESKQAEAKLLINNLGYWGFDIVNKQWSYEQIFSIDDFKRIVGNLNILKNAFVVYSTTPKTPEAKYHFENINAIEKILYDLVQMVEDIKQNYRECGNFQCGGDNIG